MANIKNLQMWKTICSDARISVKKSMFGLHTHAIYNPTGSIIDAYILEYSASDGNQMMQILNSSGMDLAHRIGDFHPQPIINGNYLAEVCVSRDGFFLVVQLKQFIQLNYEPVTGILIFEGEDAHIVGKMF